MTRAMKDSGLEWIGMIPENWTTSKIDNLYSLRNTKVSDRDYQPLSVTKQGIIPQLETAAKTDAHDDRKLVKIDDFVINSRSDRRGSCGISSLEGSVSLINTVLSSKSNISSRYYDWLFHTLQFGDEFYKWGHGIVDDLWNTNWQDMRNISIPFPPIDEQEEIATFLDFKCSQIDQLSANIKQQIEELGEYKKALITQAVTKGLDPDVEMKDSGIEWIGKIPSHWSILRIANIYTERSETGCKDDLPILMVSINSGVSNGEVLDEERTRMVVRSEDKSLYKRVYPDDLVYNTMRAWQGAFGAVRVNGLVSPAYVTAAPKIDIDSRYIEYLLRTPPAKEEMKRYSYGIADFRMRLYWQYFKNISVALPPLDEQHHIASFIDSSYFKIDSVIKKKSELLETLQDYKKSLIYDYVTGKREVPVSYRKGGSHE